MPLRVQPPLSAPSLVSLRAQPGRQKQQRRTHAGTLASVPRQNRQGRTTDQKPKKQANGSEQRRKGKSLGVKNWGFTASSARHVTLWSSVSLCIKLDKKFLKCPRSPIIKKTSSLLEKIQSILFPQKMLPQYIRFYT